MAKTKKKRQKKSKGKSSPVSTKVNKSKVGMFEMPAKKGMYDW